MVTIFIIFLLEYIKNICCFLEVFKLYPNLIIYIRAYKVYVQNGYRYVFFGHLDKLWIAVKK